MKPLAFTADTADFSSSSPEVRSVLLANPEAERVVLFQRSGRGASYIERDDQSFGTYDGVESANLSRSALRVTLNATGKAALKCSLITVRLSLEDAELQTLREGLAAILGECLEVDAAWSKPRSPTKPKAAGKPAKDPRQVRYLHVQDKALEALPAGVAEMLALETVKLDRNPGLDLDEACAVLAKLPAVRELSMTPQARIPTSVGLIRGLTKLSITDLSVEQDVPATLCALVKLRELYIQSDAAVTLPPGIGELQDLETILIAAPRWNVPDSVFRLAKLKSLSLSGCDLRQVPAAIAKLGSLESLYLTGARELDAADALRKVAPLSTLRYVQLSSRRVPPEVALCKSLRELRVVREGDEPLRLPDELWDLPALEKLDLGGNKLASLPAGVGRLSSLRELSLFDCDVTELPASLGEIPSLQVVNVVKNPRLDKLPASIAQNKALTIYR